MAIAVGKIKDLLNSEDKWTKGALYRDKLGKASNYYPNSEGAKCCLLGAARVCYPEIGKRMSVLEKIYMTLLETCGNTLTIPQWNDDENTSFQDVQNLVNELDI